MTDKQRLEISELNSYLDAIDDPRECYAIVKSRISKHQMAGEEICDDLFMLERSLLTECLGASQGR